MTPPKLTPEAAAAIVSIFERAVIIASTPQRTCLSCAYFNEAAEACTFYNPAIRPPARVIVEACPAWKNSDPF